MPRFIVATNPHQLATADKRDSRIEVDSLKDAEALLRPVQFEGCTVWKHDARAKHWRIIFDTSVTQSRLITSETYWQNVAKHEKGQP